MREVVKRLLILSGILLSMKVFAIDSSYDTSTQILRIPHLIVKDDHPKKNGIGKRYKNTRLLLKSDGTWGILDLNSKPYLDYLKRKNVIGHWIGKSSFGICIDGPDFNAGRISDYNILLMEQAKKLTGIVVGDGCGISSEVGSLTGEIIGENLFFTIEFETGEFIEFKGEVFNNFSEIEGKIMYKGREMDEDLSLSLQ